MRVVHVFKDFYPPTTGGVEQHMRLLCAEQARHMDVAVLVPSHSFRRVEENIDGVRVVRVPELGRYLSAPLCPTMPAELRRLAPDVVHLHFPNPTGDLAYLLSGWRAPVVMTYHADIVRQRPALRLYRRVFRALERHLARIIVSSPDYLASSAFLSPHRERCLVIPYGLDVEAFVLRPGEAEAVEQLRRRHGSRVVLFVGVLRPYKGLDVLLKAFRAVAGTLIVVGRGPQRPALERLARRLGLGDRIVFEGEVSETRRRLLLHACDVLVLPSTDRREAFGIVQLEAMACGKPVVSTDLLTGVRFVNRHGETGLLVPPGAPRPLAEALNRLLDDADLRLSLGTAARARVRREFTADTMVARTLEVYEGAVARASVLSLRQGSGAR